MKTFMCVVAAMAASCIGVENTTRSDPLATPQRAAAFAQAPVATAMARPSLVTAEAPDFSADAVMPDNSFGTLTLSEFRGKYVILLFYPMDFTFVCPTEIIAFDEKLDEFKKRNCEVIAVSVDSRFTHLAWKNMPRDKGGVGPVKYPLVADLTKQIAESYGVLFNRSVALRGLFLLDQKGKVRHALVNDLPLGRSVDEALRMLDALAFVETHGDEVCPANWRPGQKTVKTTFDGIADYLKDKK
jgi:peroxiredoxin (alkyl hydroperoxide reductase subunit C)